MPDFRVFNTLSREKELFEPLEPPKVRMYTCGPTVYDYAHIGNFRAYVFEDLLRRSLLLNGFQVTQVMNITDVDDKTIKGASGKGQTLAEYTAPFIEAFFEDLDELRIQRAEYYPRATHHVPEMIALIERLRQRGFTYSSGGAVYFKISEFEPYGKLSRLDPSGIKSGVRIDLDEYDKQDARDFVLWKTGGGDSFSWDSPFGRGRPGWHLECSAMSQKYLGETFDLHTGGVDNIFPHHENEIAQSEAATGKTFVRYWMHCEHLLVDGRKMSKSLGNFYTYRQLRQMDYQPTAIRYLLLGSHYRSQLNFTFPGLLAAAGAVERLREFQQRLKTYAPPEHAGSEPIHWCAERFRNALADDLAVSTALAVLFDFAREVNSLIDQKILSGSAREKALSELETCDSVLDVLNPDPAADNQQDLERIEKLVAERSQARGQRDYQRADRIRQELESLGVLLEDGPEKTRWKKKK